MTDMDLVEFLTARLDELARVGEQGAIQPGLGYEVPVSVLDFDYRLEVDPAWLLADVAAKRRIIDGLVRTLEAGDAADWDASEQAGWILAVLAAQYADHPDYREEWKPRL